MKSMVERVARAMEPDVWGTIDGDFWTGRERTIENSLARARVVIEAMREPTEQMADYGLECLPEGRHITGLEDVRAMWHVMIDVATDSHG